MKTALLAALLLATLATPAFSQHSDIDDVPIYEGTWTVHFQDKRTARFVLTEWEGTWTETGPAATRHPACGGRKLPATVHHSTTSELEFTVWGSKVSASCPDLGFTLAPVGGPNVLEGTAGEEKVRLTRTRR